MHSTTAALVRMINRVAQRLELCGRASSVSPSEPDPPPNPQGLSRSEVDALIAERIEQFRTRLIRTGELK